MIFHILLFALNRDNRKLFKHGLLTHRNLELFKTQ